VVGFSRGALWPHFRRQESLAAFTRVSITLGGQHQRGSTTYPVSLEGPRGKIEIDEPGYWEPARDLAEEIAAFLRLPLHDPGRSGKLQPHELDRTVGERGRDTDPIQAPRKLACRVEFAAAELFRVRIPPPDYRPFLGIGVIVGLFFLVPLTIELFLPLLSGRRIDWPSVALPVFLPLWVFYEMARIVVTNGGLLEVTPGAFAWTRKLPWGSRTVKIPALGLEDLVILDPETGGPRTMLSHFTHGVLVARSDHASVRLGYGLSRDELAWLRAKIVQVLGTRDGATPRPKEHKTAARPLGGALIGLVVGIVAAHVTSGALAICVALPFLQHVVSIGAALGFLAGLLTRRLVRPAPSVVLVALLLAVGSSARSDFVQDRPALQENPSYLRSSESIGGRRYLAGFLPAAALLNVVALELTLMLGEGLWRRRRVRADSPS
jgi:hypothetical protein